MKKKTNARTDIGSSCKICNNPLNLYSISQKRIKGKALVGWSPLIEQERIKAQIEVLEDIALGYGNEGNNYYIQEYIDSLKRELNQLKS